MKQKLSPISAKERIEALDILRGFALLGIILANIVWFLYPVYMQEDPSFNNEWTSFWNQADYLVKDLLAMFIDGKFVMLFFHAIRLWNGNYARKNRCKTIKFLEHL